jgi:LmbE family N-acetylglucosaminyl deacetylase
MKNVLVVAVHPDDETLGCGGTLLKHRENGDNIHWLIVTKIDKKIGYSEEQIEIRNQEINTVAEHYGFSSVHQFPFVTTCLDQYSLNELISSFCDIFNKVKPEILYLPNFTDIHSDHRIAFEAAFSCTKPFRQNYLKKIYLMEVLSETDIAVPSQNFQATTFIDISEQMDKKIEIMNIFKSEIGKHPFPRSEDSIKSLAKYRGASSGLMFAEAFTLIREIS